LGAKQLSFVPSSRNVLNYRARYHLSFLFVSVALWVENGSTLGENIEKMGRVGEGKTPLFFLPLPLLFFIFLVVQLLQPLFAYAAMLQLGPAILTRPVNPTRN
jgi:hypothetical protein